MEKEELQVEDFSFCEKLLLTEFVTCNFLVILQSTVSKQSNNNRLDEKLQQTMTLTVKRLDQYQQVCLRVQFRSFCNLHYQIPCKVTNEVKH